MVRQEALAAVAAAIVRLGRAGVNGQFSRSGLASGAIIRTVMIRYLREQTSMAQEAQAL